MRLRERPRVVSCVQPNFHRVRLYEDKSRRVVSTFEFRRLDSTRKDTIDNCIELGRVTITTEYACITTNQPDTISNLNPNHTTKQHAIVSIQLNMSYASREIHTRHGCVDTSTTWNRDSVIAPCSPLSVVTVTPPIECRLSRINAQHILNC